MSVPVSCSVMAFLGETVIQFVSVCFFSVGVCQNKLLFSYLVRLVPNIDIANDTLEMLEISGNELHGRSIIGIFCNRSKNFGVLIGA